MPVTVVNSVTSSSASSFSSSSSASPSSSSASSSLMVFVEKMPTLQICPNGEVRSKLTFGGAASSNANTLTPAVSCEANSVQLSFSASKVFALDRLMSKHDDQMLKSLKPSFLKSARSIVKLWISLPMATP